jgi:hypothetical protein
VAAVLAVAVPERRHQSRLFNLDVLEEPDGGRISKARMLSILASAGPQPA